MKYNKEVSLEIIKGDNIYRFYFPENAPLGEVYDVGFQMLRGTIQLLSQATEQNHAKAQDELTKEQGA